MPHVSAPTRTTSPPVPTGTLHTVVRYRELLVSLVGREIKARYRGSALGFLWSLVNPLLLVAVFSLVFGKILDSRSDFADPYALFLITGLFPWIWTQTALVEGTASLTANAGLIRRAVFPVDLLPVVSVCANLVHFLLALPILLAALGVGRMMGYPVLSAWSWALPLVVLLHLVMLCGAALGLSVLHVHFKDLRDLLANVLQLLFFLAPILYAQEDIPAALKRLIYANPFSPFVLAYQRLLFYGTMPGWKIWSAMIVLALAAWFGGGFLYRRLAPSIAEAV
jgi:ABC-type polysaccharide/polyol phosphate export permease